MDWKTLRSITASAMENNISSDEWAQIAYMTTGIKEKDTNNTKKEKGKE